MHGQKLIFYANRLPIEQYSEREMNSLSFDCLLSLSLGYHTRRKTGELLRILGRADAVNNFFETLIFTFFPVLIDRASPDVRCRRSALTSD